MTTKARATADLRKRTLSLINFKINRNKWKLEKHKSTKEKDNITDDFRMQLDQLNEVTNNILSKHFFNKDGEDMTDVNTMINAGYVKHPEKSARNLYSDDNSNLIDFGSWQEKLKIGGSSLITKPVQQVDPEDNEDYKPAAELRIKPESLEGHSNSKKAIATLKIKKKDIIPKNAK